MQLDRKNVSQYLKESKFEQLFIEELGWDRHTGTLEVDVNGEGYHLSVIAHKRGMVAYTCQLADSRLTIDDTILKIEIQVAKSAHEHLIIYTDANKAEQIWQWAKREPGKPIIRRHYHYFTHQSGEPLIQKLQSISFALEDEENLTVVDVAGRARQAFDIEKVTKKFYDLFQKEHNVFLEFIDGIPDEELQRWYASVMLNRLMFIYFIQKKGFLDDDIKYLNNKLAQSEQKSKDRYYKDFLCPLFFEGFAKPQDQRLATMNKLLGNVPYLNGGIFQKHQIEEIHGKNIEVPDIAFENIFTFFECYDWHLDDQPTRNDKEINPDVLGYIFEKYINQKQMGAYYTKEDITGYIAQNTVIPRIFDLAKEKCKIAFEGEQYVWRLLKDNPDRYIYDAVKKGVKLELPQNIADGLTDVSKRTEWNKSATDEYALPTEIWREVVARRERYDKVIGKLANGEIRTINDIITYNLDVCQFAQDMVENCEGPELLRAFWHVIVGRIPSKSNEKFEAGISILDPTCGSGAFLFAALNILEPLYEACLERMQLFVDDLERSGTKKDTEQFSDFKDILTEVKKHSNAKYFIYKSIIINNLFGVDIMEEAIEICKLRLFLKLVAQVDTVEKIEPLPDIDFNIRAGNTLVGFASINEVKRSMKGDFLKLQELPAIEENAQIADKAFQLFRYMQTQRNMEAPKFAEAKSVLKEKLKTLEENLNIHLAGEYGIKEGTKQGKEQYSNWLSSHKPFHWFIDFYGIIKNGGFDVIIGNPPYIEYSKIKSDYTIKGFKTEACGNLYAAVIERCISFASQSARQGFIVPTSSISTERMRPFETLLLNCGLLHSTYGFRPGKLFEGSASASLHLSIILINDSFISTPFALHHIKWNTEFRPYLFATLPFYTTTDMDVIQHFGKIPRIANAYHLSILKKIAKKSSADQNFAKTKHSVYYRTTGGLHYRVFTIFPTSSRKESSFAFDNDSDRRVAFCLYASNLWNMFYYTFSNCLDVARFEIEKFPMGLAKMEATSQNQLLVLAKELDHNIRQNAEVRVRHYRDEGNINCYTIKMRESKPIIDEIDTILAKHYSFTDEELDFIINYDIKYRMGSGLNDEED